MESKANYVISSDLEPDRPIKVARDTNQSHDLKYLFENDVGGGAADKLVTSAVGIPQFFSQKNLSAARTASFLTAAATAIYYLPVYGWESVCLQN